MDTQWMEKVALIHPDGIVHKGLSDHESLEPVPVELTGTCHYLQSALIMEEFARFMGDKENMRNYKDLADDLKDKIAAMFWEQPVTGEINRQTLFATLLYHDVIPEYEQEAGVDSLITALKKGPSGHFSTGIFGTKYILETLSESGHSNMIYDVVDSNVYPGWGYMINQGATTIWETWKESDNTYSNCHPMFGTVSEWFYRWIGGIRPDPAYPGFSRFHLSPNIPAGLDYAKCNYFTPRGEIISKWEKEGPGKVRFDFTVPVGSSAMVKIPSERLSDLAITEIRSGNSITPDQAAITTGELELNSGEYQLSATYN